LAFNDQAAPMNRDYKNLLPRVLNSLYPEDKNRNEVMEVLSSYGKASYHRERNRVHLGILKLADSKPDSLAFYTQLACDDYRDLLCAAEYPLTSKRYGLRKKDPEHYKKLAQNEIREYDRWLSRVLGT
jgi:hypothetical protein